MIMALISSTKRKKKKKKKEEVNIGEAQKHMEWLYISITIRLYVNIN